MPLYVWFLTFYRHLAYLAGFPPSPSTEALNSRLSGLNSRLQFHGKSTSWRFRINRKVMMKLAWLVKTRPRRAADCKVSAGLPAERFRMRQPRAEPTETGRSVKPRQRTGRAAGLDLLVVVGKVPYRSIARCLACPESSRRCRPGNKLNSDKHLR